MKIQNFVKIFFTVAILFFAIGSVRADLKDILHNVEVINGRAAAGEVLEFNVTLRNEGTRSLQLSTNILFPGDVSISPNTFVLGAGESNVVNVQLRIVPEQKPGRILINFMVFSEGKSLEPPIYLHGEVLESAWMFSPVRINQVSFPEKIFPGEAFDVILEINNPVKETTAVLEITSEHIPKVSRTIFIPEGINHIRVEEIEIPERISPHEAEITLRVSFSEQVFTEKKVSSSVMHTLICTIEETSDVSVFRKTYSATVTNDGNDVSVCEITSGVVGIERFLISSATEGYLVSNGEIIWEIELNPDESATVEYTLNYLPLLIAPFFIIGGIFAVWHFTRKISVTKQLITHKRGPNSIELKLQIRVKNLTDSNIDKVRIYDPLPSFAKEVKDYGTVSGKTVKKGGNREVLWEIDTLNPREERVFSYTFKTSLVVLGNVALPPTRVEFRDKNSIKEEHSNQVNMRVE